MLADKLKERMKATFYSVWHFSGYLIDPASLSDWVSIEGGISHLFQIPQTGLCLSVM